jgi:hypothetical protein
LQSDLERMQAQQRQRRDRIIALIAQADGLRGETTIEQRRRLYLEVLELDPGNAAARRGLQDADGEMARRVLAEARQKSAREAEVLVDSAGKLILAESPSPQDLEAAYSQLRKAQGIDRELPALSGRFAQLHARYVAAIERGIEDEDYAQADAFLRSASALDPESEDLKDLRERLDSLMDDELVPTSF